MNQVETKRYIYDFFILKKKHYWFLIPTPIFFYNKETFFETGLYSPSIGFTLRFLNFMIGIQIQKNLYYKNENKN